MLIEAPLLTLPARMENVPRVVEKHGGSSAQKIPSGKNHFPFIGGTNHAQASVSEAAAV